MTFNIPQYSLAAGEFSQFLLGRSDLQKYADAAQTLENMFVDYRGGASSRPGSEFAGFADSLNARVVSFEFNAEEDDNQNYIILFDDQKIRFLFENAFVLEDSKTIASMTLASPGVLTVTSHGYTTGDKVFITGVTDLPVLYYTVTVLDANTFSLVDPFGAAVATSGFSAYSSGGTVARVYTVATPFTGANLSKLNFDVNGDIITITSDTYNIYKLRRFDLLNWTLNPETMSIDLRPPTGLTATPSRSGGDDDKASWVYSITVVDQQGIESVYAPPVVVKDSVNMSAEAGSILLEWDAVEDAQYYKVYRSSISLRESGSTSTLFYKPRASQLGFIGTVYQNRFVDSNIVADFTSPPPFGNDPFSAGVITFVEITAAGSGYSDDNTEVTVTDAEGSNFLGFANVDSAGAVVGVTIIDGGKEYTQSATIAFSGDGTGATATLEIRATSNKPLTSTVFQQRQLYAGGLNAPLTIDGSKPGNFDDFSYTIPTVASDSFSFDIITMKVNRVRHMIDMPGGLLVFSAGGVALLRGTGEQRVVTAIDADAVPQTRMGSAKVKPLVIDTNVLYVQSLGATVRELEFTVVQNIYKAKDISVLANHLFSGKQLVDNAYAAEPFKLAQYIRNDGWLLPLAYLPEQEVRAWTHWRTQGKYTSIAVIPENGVNRTYVTVKRYLNGAWRCCIERFDDRLWDSVDDSWCVDCGLRLPQPTRDAELTIVEAANKQTATITADSSIFVEADEGSVIRAAGGRYKITTYNSATSVTADVEKVATDTIYLNGRVNEALSGEWSITAPVFEVGNLEHLEGETVKIVADGRVQLDKTVTGGKVVLDEPATAVTVGLSFRCRVKFLPIDLTSEPLMGKMRRPVALKIRAHESAGFKVGANFDRMYAVEQEQEHILGEPIVLTSKIHDHPLESSYDNEGIVCLEQTEPLPFTILAASFDLDLEDRGQ